MWRWFSPLLGLCWSMQAFATDRPLVCAEGNVALAMHPSLSAAWGESARSVPMTAGLGVWSPNQRFGAFAHVGKQEMETAFGSEDGVGYLTMPLVERFRLMPVEAGIKVNLWPRPDWLQVNALAFGVLSTGFHELIYDNTVIARQDVAAFGGGAGAELMVTKFKTYGMTIGARYAVRPTSLPVDRGFLSQGPTGLGGFEVVVGGTFFLGVRQWLPS